MSIKIKTHCKDCVHSGVCKYEGNVESAANKLKKMNYGCGPNDDFSWDIMSTSKNIDISLSWPDYVKSGGNFR